MKLSSKEVYEVLLRMEQDFDTGKLRYKNTLIWPIVRAQLGQQLLSGVSKGRSENKISFLRKMYWDAKYASLHAIFRLKLSSALRKVKDELTESVYISRPDEMRFQDGTSIIGKGVGVLLKEHTTFSVFELGPSGFSEYFKDFSPYFTSPHIYSEVEGLPDFEKILAEKYPQFSFNIKAVVEAIGIVWTYKSFFSVLLKGSRTKFVFFSVYFHPVCFALSLACAEEGITSVEVQHGQQGRYSPLNLGFIRTPSEESHVLPRKFWAWGDLSRKRKRDFAAYKDNNIIVAGNPSYFIPAEERASVPGIMIALQNIEPLLPEFVYRFIESTDQKILLRLHPHMDKKAKDIAASFSQYSNVIVQPSSNYPLYQLLREVDVVITNFSSVVLEAAALGKLGIVVHRNGHDLMEEHIRDREIFAAHTEDELRALISSGVRPSGPSFMETDRSVIREQLRGLFS